MIRRATLSLNEATREKREAITSLIETYLLFLQRIINTQTSSLRRTEKRTREGRRRGCRAGLRLS